MDSTYLKELFAISTSVTVIFTLGIAIVSYFGKKIFENYLSKKLEVHKIELNNLAKRNEIKFFKIHEKRALVIENIYPMIVELNDLFNYSEQYFDIKAGVWPMDELIKISNKSDEIEKYYSYNKLLFSEEICSIFEDFFEKINKRMENGYDIEKIKEFKVWETSDKNFSIGLENLKIKLENEFRVLIGTELQ